MHDMNHDIGHVAARVAAAAVFVVAFISCGLFGSRGQDGAPAASDIDAAFWGSWVRLDKQQYLYFSDTNVYARYTLNDGWSELTQPSVGPSAITATDNGIVCGYPGAAVTIKPDAARVDWLIVSGSGSTNYYRRSGPKTATFTGTFKKDGSLLGRSGDGRALAPAVNVSLVIQNVLNARDKQTVTTDPYTAQFAASNTIPGDSYAVTDASSGVTVTVTPLRRDEDIGVLNVSGKDQDFKAECDFSPTPLEYGYFSSKFMVAGYQFTPVGGSAQDLYYDVTLRIRNTGQGPATDLYYALEPSSGLDLRSDSAAMSGRVAGPLAAGAAHPLVLHLRRPSAVDPSEDVAIETISVAVTDASGYIWKDEVELAFWRKLVYFEVFRFQSGPMLGEIASPENDASGAWLSPEGEPVEWYYLPYRREGYTIGIYPAGPNQGPTKYSIGFDASVLAGVLDKFNALSVDSNEPNDSAGAAAALPHGQVAMGIIGPGDADFYVTGSQPQQIADTTPPAEISNFEADPGDRSLTLSWTEPIDGDYWYLDIEGSPGDLWQDPRKGETSAVFRGLTNGVEYTFNARSVDYDGNQSNAVQIKAIPAWTKGGARSYYQNGYIVSIPEIPPNGKFRAPEDLAFDANGRIVVADTGNHRVQLLAADGSWLWTWGKAGGASGAGDGEFVDPSEVAISGSTLVVAERGNDRIQAFDLASPQASRIAAWGSPGSGQGQFADIDGLACDGSYLYVSDTGNDRVQVFSLGGAWQKTWTGPFSDPRGLEIREGYIYVINNRYESGYHPFILKLDVSTPSGDVTGVVQSVALSGGILSVPSDIAMSATTIFFSERQLGQLSAYEFASGNFLWRKAGRADSIGDLGGLALGPTGDLFGTDVWYSVVASFVAATGSHVSDVGESSYPSVGTLGAPIDAAVAADGSRVYVLDSSYNRVGVFSADGSTVIDAWGKSGGRSGTGQGEFYQPNRLAVGPLGRIFVADLGNNRVQALNQDGSFATAWGSSAPAAGSGTTDFARPMDVAISAADNLAYVADESNRRVQIYSAIAPFAYVGAADLAVSLGFPNCIAADVSGGIVLVGQNYRPSVFRFDCSTSEPIWPAIVDDQHNSGIRDVETDDDGNIYIALASGAAAYEIRKFSPAGSLIATIKPGADPFLRLDGIGLTSLKALNNPGRIYATDSSRNKVFIFDPVP